MDENTPTVTLVGKNWMYGSYVPSMKPLQLGVKKIGVDRNTPTVTHLKISLWDIVNLLFNYKNRSLYSIIDFENLNLYQKLLFFQRKLFS